MARATPAEARRLRLIWHARLRRIELQDLAGDIKEHGLLHPIVLDGDGFLIDGRNRLQAGEIAGGEPQSSRARGYRLFQPNQ